MRFTILPAVDIADGRIVRSGSEADEGALADPLLVALAWQADGAEWIHLVDIDAAFGRGSNSDLLASMVGKLDVAVELAGGIRDEASLDRALRTGCERVVLSTAALRDKSWCSRVISTHGERIAVGLDIRIDSAASGERTHRLAARGAASGADGDGGDLWEALAWLEQAGTARYVVTDVSRDGMLSGPNVELCRDVAGAGSAPVIASGGVSNLDDLVSLAGLHSAGAAVEGAVVGAALHAGRFTLVEALSNVRRRRRSAGAVLPETQRRA